MKTELEKIILPEAYRDNSSVIVSDGYAMNIGVNIRGGLPYKPRQPYNVPELRVMNVLDGQGAILLNLVRRELTAGDILAVPAGLVVELISFSDDIRIRLMSSQSESIEGVVHIHPSDSDAAELDSMMLSIWNGLHLEPKATEYVRFQFLAFLSRIKYIAGNVSKPHSMRADEIFHQFIEYVNIYATQNRRIPFYADKLGITPHHLSAVVKQVSGESAMEWINRAVIQRAKLMLSQGLTALQVSEAIGFTDAPYFNRYFKRLTGLTPGEYQKR